MQNEAVLVLFSTSWNVMSTAPRKLILDQHSRTVFTQIVAVWICARAVGCSESTDRQEALQGIGLPERLNGNENAAVNNTVSFNRSSAAFASIQNDVVCQTCPVSKSEIYDYITDENQDSTTNDAYLHRFCKLSGIYEALPFEEFSSSPTDPNIGMPLSSRQNEKMEWGYANFAFNVLASDRLGLRRQNIPDTRHARCNERYQKRSSLSSSLPAASIVICYHNEALSVLIRMINSIIDRTPPSLLHEILLIDDLSNPEMALNWQVKEYAAKNWVRVVTIKFYRAKQRQGLIRAKNLGAMLATGEVLVFLDSHCEVNVRWLEPLLERIAEDPKRVVCPVVDIIDYETFAYSETTIAKGSFSWALVFKWLYLRSEDYLNDTILSSPIRSPAMSGGLFAIRRDFFFELGAYDWGMEVWGFENVEMSLRVWMCGGQLEIISCSRVGHVFRSHLPYVSKSTHNDQDVTQSNALRVALVWLDNYKAKFYEVKPHLVNVYPGILDDRIRLRQSCRSFQWYLQNICADCDLN